MNTPLCDAAFLKTIEELSHLYCGFPLESQVWARHGHRRSPYRALILFGLSPRTRDWLLVDMCRQFFNQFPNVASFLGVWPGNNKTIKAIVRKEQLPFVESAIQVIQSSGGIVPQDSKGLMMIKGVGEKVAECVIAYGWGKEALPVDGNVCRVMGRLLGTGLPNPRSHVSSIREQLKRVYLRNRGRLVAQGVAMIDIHELFRLHGQVVCTKVPRCGQCPVSSCRLRQHPYLASTRPAVSAMLWQEWRELLLDSSCGKMPAKITNWSEERLEENYEPFGI
jgi:endonuclease-3